MTVWLIGLFVLAAIFTLALAVYGSLETTKIPFLAVPFTPRDFGLAYEEVSFLSYDGLKLTGWFLPAPEASPVTLIVLHGL